MNILDIIDSGPGNELDAIVGRNIFSQDGKNFPCYSTDIACALKVLEKLRSMGKEILIHVQGAHYLVGKLNMAGWENKPGFSITHESLAMAICLATTSRVSISSRP